MIECSARKDLCEKLFSNGQSVYAASKKMLRLVVFEIFSGALDDGQPEGKEIFLWVNVLRWIFVVTVYNKVLYLTFFEMFLKIF